MSGTSASQPTTPTSSSESPGLDARAAVGIAAELAAR